MKSTKYLFPVLLCTLLVLFSSCKETNVDRLKAMQGTWVSAKSRPPFILFEEGGQYMVTTQQKTHLGNTRMETYQIVEMAGNLYIETGLSVLLTYDKGNDRIHLSPGGEYNRSKSSIQKVRP